MNVTSLRTSIGTEIDTIYHISDIHIRNNGRHEEYAIVFSRLINKIKQETNHKSILVITGDIFHTKVELSPEAIQLSSHLFRGLSEIIPVFIIAGNHDCNPNNPKRLDAISPVVEEINNMKNLYYLRKLFHYSYT